MSTADPEIVKIQEALDRLSSEVRYLRDLIEKKRRVKDAAPFVGASAPAGADGPGPWENLGALTDIAHASGDGVEFFFYTRDQRIGRSIHKSGNYSKENLLLAVSLVERYCGQVRDRVFVDVGANIGTTSVTAARVLGFRKVLAVEPDPENFKLLLLNRLSNGLEGRMECLNAALTDREGELSLLLNPRNFGAHRIDVGPTDGAGKDLRKVTIRGMTLRDALSTHGIRDEELGLLWMDTQGHEGHILKGAGDLLKRRPPVCMEFWPHGLELASGFGTLVGLVKEHYTHFINLREKTRENQGPELIPVSQIEAFAGTVTERKFTDLLVLHIR